MSKLSLIVLFLISITYLSLLNAGKVDALVYDIVPLQYILPTEKEEIYRLSKRNINPQHYGFVFPVKSELRRTVDLEILRLKESEDIEQIVSGYVR